MDENQAFVCGYQINIDDDDPENHPSQLETVFNPLKSARFFVTTPNLLRLASTHCALLQADATYKLTWLGFPVLIIGISDANNVFHPFGLALTREEKAEDFEFLFKSFQIGIESCGFPSLGHVDLLADAADAITNGFVNAFSQDSFKRGNKLMLIDSLFSN